jgi:hypothetical protein
MYAIRTTQKSQTKKTKDSPQNFWSP